MSTHLDSHYRSYLIRFWRAGKAAPWRATVEDPHTGEVHNFVAPERLYQFLAQQLGQDVSLSKTNTKPGD